MSRAKVTALVENGALRSAHRGKLLDSASSVEIAE